MAMPIMVSGEPAMRARKSRRPGRRARRAGRSGVSAVSMALWRSIPRAPSGPDARVEQHVGEVAEDLRHHGDEHGDEGPRLYERDVLVERSLEHHPSEARI